jgi:hypothetical protein
MTNLSIVINIIKEIYEANLDGNAVRVSRLALSAGEEIASR